MSSSARLVGAEGRYERVVSAEGALDGIHVIVFVDKGP